MPLLALNVKQWLLADTDGEDLGKGWLCRCKHDINAAVPGNARRVKSMHAQEPYANIPGRGVDKRVAENMCGGRNPDSERLMTEAQFPDAGLGRAWWKDECLNMGRLGDIRKNQIARDQNVRTREPNEILCQTIGLFGSWPSLLAVERPLDLDDERLTKVDLYGGNVYTARVLVSTNIGRDCPNTRSKLSSKYKNGKLPFIEKLVPGGRFVSKETGPNNWLASRRTGNSSSLLDEGISTVAKANQTICMYIKKRGCRSSTASGKAI